jgi:hypothetical protein
MDERTEAVRDLVELRVPPGQAAASLQRFPWDSDVELRTLTRVDAVRALRRYGAGGLSADELEQWAQALEGRDDVGLEDGYEDLLKDFLFELSTPELTEPITDASISRWLSHLT